MSSDNKKTLYIKRSYIIEDIKKTNKVVIVQVNVFLPNVDLDAFVTIVIIIYYYSFSFF